MRQLLVEHNFTLHCYLQNRKPLSTPLIPALRSTRFECVVKQVSITCCLIRKSKYERTLIHLFRNTGLQSPASKKIRVCKPNPRDLSVRCRWQKKIPPSGSDVNGRSKFLPRGIRQSKSVLSPPRVARTAEAYRSRENATAFSDSVNVLLPDIWRTTLLHLIEQKQFGLKFTRKLLSPILLAENVRKRRSEREDWNSCTGSGVGQSISLRHSMPPSCAKWCKIPQTPI